MASGLLADERINDDRVFVDATLGLFLVCDASGPTYGGYHAPFAIDGALAALARAFAGTRASTRERLGAALAAADTEMRSMYEAHQRVLAARTGLAAAREASEAVRPPAWRDYPDAFAGFGASIAACAVGPDALVGAQVGVCHVHALADGALFLRDGSLASTIEAEGVDMPVEEEHRRVPATLLGVGETKIELREIPRAPLVLCTDGAWASASAVRELRDARSNDEVRRILDRARIATRDDATAVVLR